VNIAPTYWFDLGPFRILVRPCPTNPAWRTHWIYRGNKLISKSLSVPSLADCEHLEKWGDNQYATESHQPDRHLRGRAKIRRRAAPSTA